MHLVKDKKHLYHFFQLNQKNDASLQKKYCRRPKTKDQRPTNYEPHSAQQRPFMLDCKPTHHEFLDQSSASEQIPL